MTSESEFWGPKTNIEEMQMVGIQVAKPSDIESTTMSKVTWRLVPFLML